MKNENMKKNNKGFSLVELIVVIAIMAVLMVILAPAMLRYVEKTRVQKDESALSEVANAAELALGEESIYNKVMEKGKTDVILTVSSSSIIDDVDGTSYPVAADVKKTTGDSVKFASKEYSGKTVKIWLHYNDTRQAFVLAKTASGKPFTTQSNTSDLVSY